MKLDFTFIKNDEYIMNRKDIKCIYNKSLTFIIDKTKYKLEDNILEKDTEEDKITFDFKEENCKILLKKENLSLCLNLDVINFEKKDNIVNIKYCIESENDVINTIIINIKNS